MLAEVAPSEHGLLALGFEADLLGEGRNPLNPIVCLLDHVSVTTPLVGNTLTCLNLRLSEQVGRP